MPNGLDCHLHGTFQRLPQLNNMEPCQISSRRISHRVRRFSRHTLPAHNLGAHESRGHARPPINQSAAAGWCMARWRLSCKGTRRLRPPAMRIGDAKAWSDESYLPNTGTIVRMHDECNHRRRDLNSIYTHAIITADTQCDNAEKTCIADVIIASRRFRRSNLPTESHLLINWSCS